MYFAEFIDLTIPTDEMLFGNINIENLTNRFNSLKKDFKAPEITLSSVCDHRSTVLSAFAEAYKFVVPHLHRFYTDQESKLCIG